MAVHWQGGGRACAEEQRRKLGPHRPSSAQEDGFQVRFDPQPPVCIQSCLSTYSPLMPRPVPFPWILGVLVPLAVCTGFVPSHQLLPVNLHVLPGPLHVSWGRPPFSANSPPLLSPPPFASAPLPSPHPRTRSLPK